MNSKVRSILVQLLLLGAGILMLYLAFRGQDLTKLLADMRSADYSFVGWSLLVLLFSHYIRALRWKMLIKPMGFVPRNMSAFAAVLIGYLANLAVPRLGEVLRCGIINRTDQAPVDQLIGTVIMERLADVLMLLLGIILTLCTQYEVLKTFFLKQVWTGLAQKGQNAPTLLLIFIIVGLLLLAVSIFFFSKKKEKLMTLAPVKRASAFLKGILTGLQTILKMRRASVFLLYSVLIWALYMLSTALVFKAIPSTSALPFSASLLVLTAGSVGMVAPVQGGIGAYHFMVTQALILLRIAPEAALCYATINHSSQLLSILFAGGLSLLYILISFAATKPGVVADLGKKPANIKKSNTLP